MEMKLPASRAGRILLARNICSLYGTPFCQRLSKPQGLVRLERLGQLNKQKSDDLIGTRTRDFPACTIALQPSVLPRAVMIYVT
jgi:hypothetical protein